MQTTLTNPWSSAEQHCQDHIEVVNELNRLISKLRDVDVSSVMPIVSIHSSTLFIIPLNDKDIRVVRRTAEQLKSATGEVVDNWTKFKSGDFWYYALKLPFRNITIHLATQLPASKPTEFDIE